MNVSACFLSLFILYAEVIRAVLGTRDVLYLHETYVKVPDRTSSMFVTKAKGSLISFTNVLTADLFADEPEIAIDSYVMDELCEANFLFKSKTVSINFLEVPFECTTRNRVIPIPPTGWKAEVGSEAAVSYYERTSENEHRTKTVFIETVTDTEYVLTAKSQQEVMELWPGSSIVQSGKMIGMRTKEGRIIIVNHDIYVEHLEHINAILAKKNMHIAAADVLDRQQRDNNNMDG